LFDKGETAQQLAVDLRVKRKDNMTVEKEGEERK
jgi:hypothetical protein